MTFRGACIISILAHYQDFLQAPLIFLWIILINYILEIDLKPITLLLVGTVIAVYQQFSSHEEDIADGFFDRCINELHPLTYAFTKIICLTIGTLLPMAFFLPLLSIRPLESLMILSQWIILSACISCVLILNVSLRPLKLLLGWLPLLTSPFIFLVSFLRAPNRNNLIILLGCDTILLSTAYVSFIFQKAKGRCFF